MPEERVLQKTPKGQYMIYLPIQVVRMLNWEKGDKIQIDLENRGLKLSKKE